MTIDSLYLRQWFSPSLCISIILLLVLMYESDLIDILTPFLYPPLCLAVVATFLIVFAGALIKAFAVKKGNLIFRFRFVLLDIIVALIASFMPFSYFSSMIDFNFNLPSRINVVHMVEEGKLSQPYEYNRTICILPGPLKHLSRGGEIMATGRDGLECSRDKTTLRVLFFTFRGILSHYSGFEYCADDQPPYLGDEPKEVKKLSKNWFWVAN